MHGASPTEVGTSVHHVPLAASAEAGDHSAPAQALDLAATIETDQTAETKVLQQLLQDL